MATSRPSYTKQKRPPNYTQLVLFYRAIAAVSDFEAVPETDELIGEALASIRPLTLSNEELITAQQVTEISQYEIRIRWPDFEIGRGDWLIDDDHGNRFDIVSIRDPDGTAREVEMICKGKSIRVGGPATYR